MKNYTTKTLTLLAASLALATGAHAQYVFNGAVSSDPTVNGNYVGGTAPTVNATDSGPLDIANGTAGSPFVYSAADGSTTFNGNLRVSVGALSDGTDTAAGSELDVTGGNLLINSSGTSTLGFRGAGTIGVSGGSLTVNGSDSFYFGNESAATANVSGGTFTIGNGFLFSRDGGTTTINLSGNGVFNVTNSSGTQYAASGGNGIATINLAGNGIFEQTGSNAINLGGNFNINFATGSMGQLSLLGDNAATLNGLIQGGHIEVNGVSDTSLADYKVIGASSATSQGIIELATASVPEPSSWAMLLSGGLLLVGAQRFLRNRSA